MLDFVVRSNIGTVIAELESIEGSVTQAVKAALDPKRWEPVARKRAKEVLEMLAESPEEHGLVERFVGTVSAGVFGPMGMVWRMSAPSSGDVMQPIRDVHLGPLLKTMNVEKLAELQDFILQWVREAKRKDARDAGKTDEEIANGIYQILWGGSPGRESARDALLPHLQDYAEQVKGSSGLNGAKVELWLNTVLDAWAEVALEEVAGEVGSAVLKVFQA